MEDTPKINFYKTFSAIAGDRVTFTSSAPYVPQYVKSNLTATSDPGGVYANRVQGRQILLENPVRDSQKKKDNDDKQMKIRQMRKQKKLKMIGKREAKEKSVWKLDKAQAKYQLFIPLHHLWMGYMSELLGLNPPPEDGAPPSTKSVPPSQGMHSKLVKADFHGALIRVSQSKNPCLVGLAGIILHETENAFKIITNSNTIKLIPKQNSIFSLVIPLYSTLTLSHGPHTPLPLPDVAGTSETTVLDKPHLEFQLYGNQFRFRSAERAGRKFKHKETIEL